MRLWLAIKLERWTHRLWGFFQRRYVREWNRAVVSKLQQKMFNR